MQGHRRRCLRCILFACPFANTATTIWARFYDLETVSPIFTGRDRIPRERLDDIEYERRNGYGYLGTWPAKLLEKEYPKWRERVGREAR
jgi:hypothetical protein